MLYKTKQRKETVKGKGLGAALSPFYLCFCWIVHGNQHQ